MFSVRQFGSDRKKLWLYCLLLSLSRLFKIVEVVVVALLIDTLYSYSMKRFIYSAALLALCLICGVANAFLLAKVKSLTCRRVNVHIKQFIVKKVLQAGAAERRIFSEEYLHNTIVEDSMYLSSFCFMGCEYLIGAIALVVLCALIAKSSISLFLHFCEKYREFMIFKNVCLVRPLSGRFL